MHLLPKTSSIAISLKQIYLVWLYLHMSLHIMSLTNNYFMA